MIINTIFQHTFASKYQSKNVNGNFYQIIKTNFLLILILLLPSCAPTISNFDSYQKELIAKTSFMPSTENFEGKPVKIAVFKLDENDNQTAKQAGLGNSISADIENILTKNQLAKIVDRKSTQKLQEEINLAEMKKTGSYKGPEVADYAISGIISNASFTKKYTSSRTIFNSDGTVSNIPAKFTYIANVGGNIKIYELPSMSVVENFEFSGKEARNENVQRSGGVSIAFLEIGGEHATGADRDDNLIRKAGTEAIEYITTDIKNFLAKKGYILEKRILKSKSIFKISVGKSDGIKQGDEFEIIGQYESENPITGKTEIEKRIITTGKVSDKIDPKYSWVIIDDQEKINKIRIGDVVKFKYERSFFDKVGRFADNVN